MLLASAALICKLASTILPPPMRHWGLAMQHEMASVPNGRAALSFALGCLGCALRITFAFHLRDPLRVWIDSAAEVLDEQGSSTIRSMNDLLRHPRHLVIACAATATGLGVVHMVVAGAPYRHVVMNVTALLIGLVVAAGIVGALRGGRFAGGLTSIVLGLSLLATAMFGISVDGAARWVAVAGVPIQPSQLVVPVMTICFARARDPLSAVGLALAVLALAVQFDRTLAGSLAAALTVLMLLRPERTVLFALAAAIVGFGLTLAQGDNSEAMPYVDRIVSSAFLAHPLPGLAVVAGAALILLPAVAGRIFDAENREVYYVFGALWLAMIVASALGNSPTPLVAYGGSAIVGYVISLIGFPSFAAGAPRHSRKAGIDRHASRPRPGRQPRDAGVDCKLRCRQFLGTGSRRDGAQRPAKELHVFEKPA